ncbi:hypothetical protein MPSEU_000410700 [Mayamaea pseudoterrestris]|nr:hypothetical protein MPSEU_000410700 [Mayamaea pseudoterrestris]
MMHQPQTIDGFIANRTMSSSYQLDPFASSVNPSLASKKAIRRSFRSRAAFWNPFRQVWKESNTESSSSHDSLQGTPSNSVVLPITQSAKLLESQGMIRAISSETLLTTMECVDMSVAFTELRSNLRSMQEDTSEDSFVSESVDDEYEDDSEEEIVSLVMIDVDLSTCNLDELSDVSDVSAETSDDYSMGSWLESPTDLVSRPIGEI